MRFQGPAEVSTWGLKYPYGAGHCGPPICLVPYSAIAYNMLANANMRNADAKRSH